MSLRRPFQVPSLVLLCTQNSHPYADHVPSLAVYSKMSIRAFAALMHFLFTWNKMGKMAKWARWRKVASAGIPSVLPDTVDHVSMCLSSCMLQQSVVQFDTLYMNINLDTD